MDTKYDQSKFDGQAQEKWASEGTFTFNSENKGKLFSIDTPPPTVSGSLHIGHIFSYTQADIIARFKRLSGFNVFYPFGFDDNGLATERFVEKKHGVTGFGMKRSEFINLCLKQSKESQKEFQDLWQRIGISADWTKTYSTISPEAQKISQASFVDLYKKGFIYRKEEPAIYCTTCFTSVAQAELDDLDMPAQFNNVIFKAEDGSDLIIATTRPELLPSCVALFYHPEDERYTHLKGTKATVPLFGYDVPLLTDDLVEKDKGTGLVMCCTFGDKNDIAWFKKYNLPYRESIGFDGKWKKETGELAGLRAVNARAKVLELLQAAEALKEQRNITHSVNVHERCKKPIEYVVLTQWFLNILDHKEEFLQQARENLNWFPGFMHSRYKDWVEHLQWDWCLSRQRFYGIPFPIWHCLDCKHIIVAKTEDLPLDPQETMPQEGCPQCKSTNLKPDTDVMDTWNTSSLTPYICAQLAYPTMTDPLTQAAEKSFLPMSMRPQAHDIIRTWTFYTLIKTWLHNKTMPWNNVVISGHVLSSQKDKISKSKGNNPLDPSNLLEQYPADVIRYWTASGSLGQDVAFSENQFKIGLKLQTKLWNAFRFVKDHINEAPQEQPKNLGAVNEWLLHTCHEAFVAYNKALEENEVGHALAATEKFFWNNFCDNYLEIIKEQLFKPEYYSPEKIAATRWTLHHVGLRLLQMFGPYMPHITEVLYETLYKEKCGISSLHITEFATIQQAYTFPDSVTVTEKLFALVGAIRRMKSEKQLSLKVPLASLTIHSVNKDIIKLLTPHEQLLKGITHAEIIAYGTGDVDQSTLTQENETWVASLDLDHLQKTNDEEL